MPELEDAILYIGGGASQIVPIASLSEAAFYVAATDRNLSSPCATVASDVFTVDATDIAGLIEVADKISKHRRLVGVYGVADYAFASVMAVARHIGLKGPVAESVELFTDKARTVTRLRDNGLPVPETHWVGQPGKRPPPKQLEALSGQNIVVKARSLNNSSGVHVLPGCNLDMIHAAIDSIYAQSDGVLIESFVEGYIANVDGLMLDGSFFSISTTRRRNDPDIPSICTTMIQPAGGPEFTEKASALAESAARALGMVTGPLTVDLIVAGDGEMTILEVSPHFHNIGSEILRKNGNPLLAYFTWLRGDPGWRTYLPNGSARHGVLCQKLIDQSGTIVSIEGREELARQPGYAASHFVRDVGDRVSCGPLHKDLLCLVWATGRNEGEINALIEHVECHLVAVINNSDT
ncbi:MAG: ATP-grasp domain-containing protein [Alphaproteobacteria bacterium]|nr:ATP-grasp domain-containing protein [Alphaproteobacteria bacterium]